MRKWVKNAKEGIVVAGGQGRGNKLNQLDTPQGVIVNEMGDVYVADQGNCRVMCWPLGSNEGRVVVGGGGSDQLGGPKGLSFDHEHNLYVADWTNNRIQRFEVKKESSKTKFTLKSVVKIVMIFGKKS